MRFRAFATLWVLFFLVLCTDSGFAAPKAAKAAKGGKAGASVADKAAAARAKAAPKTRKTAFWACSDGKGTVSLFWLPTGGDWPEGGFRLERISKNTTTILATKLGPGFDASTLMPLPDAQAAEIREFSDKLTRQALTEDDQHAAITTMGRTASIDLPYGLALGVRYVDTAKGSAGKRSYRLTPLGAEDEALMTLTSDEIDPSKRTPGPSQAVNFRAQPRLDGVALFWSDPPADPLAPVVAYTVDRAAGSGRNASNTSLTSQPLILERYLRRGQPEFLDDTAARQDLAYDVTAVDLFGRRSAPVRATVLAKDFPELAPPPDVRVEGVKGAVLIAWTNTDNVYVGGFMIERSPFPNGPFQPAVQAPLPREASEYEDKGLEDGKDYYYRMRSVSVRGETGTASPTYLARTGASSAPGATNDGIDEETIVASSTGDEVVLPAPTPRRKTPPQPVRRPAPQPAPQPAPEPAPAPEPPPVPAPAPPPVAPPPVAQAPAAPPPAPEPAPAPAPLPPPAPAPAPVVAQPAAPAAAPAAEPPPAPVTPAAAPAAAPAAVATAAAPEPAAPPAAADAPAAPAEDAVPAPSILTIKGAGGKVTISMAPGDPANLTVQFLVYRSSSAANMGVTVGRPLPGDTRQWQDASAEPGNSYWYRIVAIDARKRQSEPSRPKWVRVNR